MTSPTNTSFPDQGKIQNGFFKEFVFPYCGASRNEVLVGPKFGVDVSLVHLNNGMAMAMTSDPLSLIPTLGLQESAWLSVQLMCNDMATTGFAPQYAQFTLNLPPTISESAFQEYWQYIHKYCKQYGTAITGGHTGRFEGQNSTVAGGGTMITILPAERALTSMGGQPGDSIIMTKTSALIATSILALSFPDKVMNELGKGVHDELSRQFYETSALEAGLAMGELNLHNPAVTAMHDVTEGGVLGAIYELAHASECGVDIYRDAIPVTEAQSRISALFGIDPHYCVGAGSMLITCKSSKSEVVLQQLFQNNIRGTVVGKLTERAKGIAVIENGERQPFSHPGADPYWSAFFVAMKNGWK